MRKISINRTGENVFVAFLLTLRVKHTTHASNKYFNEHPHKYNLFGISQMLSDYGVKNGGTKIKKKEDIVNIQTPFIAHTGSGFVVIDKIIDNQISYLWKGKRIILSVDKFLQSWTGFILLAEPSEKSIEPNYKENRKKTQFIKVEKSVILLLLASLAVISLLSHNSISHTFSSISLFLNLIGFIVGYLLVLKQLNINNDYSDKICSVFKQNDCNNILESPAAKLGGIVGWSEIGLGYFISNLLVLIFYPQLILYMSIINICTLPFSFWSIWYQKVVAKQWCVLCLIVQFLFWLIFINNSANGLLTLPSFKLNSILLVTSIYFIPILLINLLIPVFSKANKAEVLAQEINSIKANKHVLFALLKQQPQYKVDIFDSRIVFGNPEAEVKISVLSNPHCNPCAKMHFRIERLLEETKNKFCIQYILSSFNEELIMSNKVLISCYFNNNQDRIREIMKEWYEHGQLKKEEFFRKYSYPIDLEVERESAAHANWIDRSDLSATPTILINGYKLPDNFNIEDLRYI